MSIQHVQKGAVPHSKTTERVNGVMDRATARLGGYTAIAGAVSMFIGGALWGSSGADLWAALATGDMAGYLVAAAAAKTVLVVNTSFWIFGVLLLGVAGTMLTHLCTRRPALAQVALVCFRTAVPLAIVAFLSMVALVVQIGADTSATAVALAEVVGWIGARADDLATVLIVGIGPLLISLAGQGDWVPTWLVRWSFLTGLTGLLSLASIYNPALAALSFIIVPVGIGWMIAVGIVLLRRSK